MTPQDLLAEFERRTDKAWMPMRVFRTNEEAAADEVRHEVWQEATEIVREFARSNRGEEDNA